MIALLGFFDSSVAAKSLVSGGAGRPKRVSKEVGKEIIEEADGIQGITVSANRKLVALGVANIESALGSRYAYPSISSRILSSDESASMGMSC